MDNKELLRQGLDRLDISYGEIQINSFITYLAELKKWNRAYNLTALKTDNDIIIKHFLDSLLYLRAIPKDITRAADAGTGAGFPGIPINIIRPDIEMVLVEPVRKKAGFLRHIIRQLKLSSVFVIEDRIENLGNDHLGQYDVIVTRATFSITRFLDSACPYIKKNGLLILSKGPKLSEELKALEASYCPGDVVKNIIPVHLPFSEAERKIVVLRCAAVH